LIQFLQIEAIVTAAEMKRQLAMLITTLLLHATVANRQCDQLRQQCNQFKARCRPGIITMKSCCDIIDLPLAIAPSGIYQLETNCSCGSPFTAAVDAYCDMEAGDGGWMVIQRNSKSHLLTFNKNWKDYEEGFGDLSTGHMWYGLKALSCHTKEGNWELRIDFQFANGSWFYLHYNNFKVGSPSTNYKLTIGGLTGTTTDPFVSTLLNGKPFSNPDNENDGEHRNCAFDTKSGWWHTRFNCFHINLNWQPPYVYLNGKDHHLPFVEMKVRPRDCIN